MENLKIKVWKIEPGFVGLDSYYETAKENNYQILLPEGGINSWEKEILGKIIPRDISIFTKPVNFCPPYISNGEILEYIVHGIDEFKSRINTAESLIELFSPLTKEQIEGAKLICDTAKKCNFEFSVDWYGLEEIIDDNLKEWKTIELPFDKEGYCKDKKIKVGVDYYINNYGEGSIIYLYIKRLEKWIDEARKNKWLDYENNKEVEKLEELGDEIQGIRSKLLEVLNSICVD